MLARVVLHPAAALFPIKRTGRPLPDRKRAVNVVQDSPVLLLHVAHARVRDRAGVGALPAALRKEGRAVKLHGKATFYRLAARDHGLKFVQIRVLIV